MLFLSLFPFFFYFHFPIVGSSDEMVVNFHIAVRKLKVKIVLRTAECLKGRLLAERMDSRNDKKDVELMENLNRSSTQTFPFPSLVLRM